MCIQIKQYVCYVNMYISSIVYEAKGQKKNT